MGKDVAKIIPKEVTKGVDKFLPEGVKSFLGTDVGKGVAIAAPFIIPGAAAALGLNGPTSFLVGEGAGAGAAGAGAGAAAGATGGALLPAAIAEADPTFGALTQTGAGVWENVGNTAAFGGLGADAAEALGISSLDAGAGAGGEALGSGLRAQPGNAGTIPGASIGTAEAPTGLNQGPAAVSAPAAGGAPAASGGLTGIAAVDDALAWMKKNALGLGLLGLGANAAMRKPPQLPNEQELQQMGTETAATARQLISQFQSGNLSAGQQASLDQLTQQTKARITQYFASIGQADSTAYQQAIAQVDQQAVMMKQEMLDNTLQQGLQAIGVAQGPLNEIAQFKLQEDKNLRDAFGNFASAAGNMLGRMSATPTNTTATPTVSSVSG